MKYSFTYVFVLFVSITLAGFAYECWLERLTTLCGVMTCLSFVLFMAVAAAPDNEKYTDEYNKKRKGL